MSKVNMAHLALSDNGFLFDTSTGRTFTLNQTGTFILKLLIRGAGFGEIIDELTDHFGTKPEVARSDTVEFMACLNDLGIKTSISVFEDREKNLSGGSS